MTLSRIESVLTWGLHLLIAVLLILVLWRADHWSMWLLAFAYATFYLLGVIPRGPLFNHRLLWIVLLCTIWIGLIWDGPEPAYLAFPMFFLIVLHTSPLRSALIIALITAIAIAALSVHLGFSVGVVTGPALGAAVAWILGTCFQLLATTVKELVDARTAAIRASKSAGELAERARIAGEIHDTVAQGLSSIQMLLHAAEKRVSDPQALAQLQLARQTTAENLAETRNIIAALQPQPLVGATLPVALARVAANTPMGERISFAVDGMARQLPDQMEADIVRIAQTLVGNVLRHSQAQSAKMTLTYQPDQILLDVLDDGIGFDVPAVLSGSSVGLPTAQKRAEKYGGSIIIESSPGAGTGISLCIPHLERTSHD